MVQWLRLHTPIVCVWGRALGSIPSQGTRSHMLQLRSHAIMKMDNPTCSQINIFKILLKSKNNYNPRRGPSPRVHSPLPCAIVVLRMWSLIFLQPLESVTCFDPQDVAPVMLCALRLVLPLALWGH